MGAEIRKKINKLVEAISTMEGIIALGQTNDVNVIPEPGQSDIDIFVYGEHIPAYEERKMLYEQHEILYEECKLQVCVGGVWGTGDIFLIEGVETMFMYFTIGDTVAYLDEILEGRHPDSMNGFYPVGRCSTLLHIHTLYDRSNFFADIKKKLSVYPEKLSIELLEYHLSRSIDEEDFGRAAMRKDVLFYHQVLEHAMDHFLQAVFAANRTYFPSRKRTKEYLEHFSITPNDCYARITTVIQYACEPEGINHSISLWNSLVEDFKSVMREEQCNG